MAVQCNFYSTFVINGVSKMKDPGGYICWAWIFYIVYSLKIMPLFSKIITKHILGIILPLYISYGMVVLPYLCDGWAITRLAFVKMRLGWLSKAYLWYMKVSVILSIIESLVDKN